MKDQDGRSDEMETDRLKGVIEAEYHKSFSYSGYNCRAKTLNIIAEAKRLGKKAELIFCIAVLPWNEEVLHRSVTWKKGGRIYAAYPHLYPRIDGERVDVVFDPETEEKVCRNSEIRILMPINISIFERLIRLIYSILSVFD